MWGDNAVTPVVYLLVCTALGCTRPTFTSVQPCRPRHVPTDGASARRPRKNAFGKPFVMSGVWVELMPDRGSHVARAPLELMLMSILL